jgi:hypothetical protein
MMRFRRGVGSDSSSSQITLALTSGIRGRFSPRTAPTTVDRAEYNAANTSAHRRAGCAILPTSGAISDAAHRTIALTMTTNRPNVESSSRPVNAITTGRTTCSDTTRIAPATRKPKNPTLPNWRIGASSAPNGNGWGTWNRLSTTMITAMIAASTTASTTNRRIEPPSASRPGAPGTYASAPLRSPA